MFVSWRPDGTEFTKEHERFRGTVKEILKTEVKKMTTKSQERAVRAIMTFINHLEEIQQDLAWLLWVELIWVLCHTYYQKVERWNVPSREKSPKESRKVNTTFLDLTPLECVTVTTIKKPFD